MSEYEELALKLRSWAHVCRDEGARHALSHDTLDEIADAILVLSAALTLCNSNAVFEFKTHHIFETDPMLPLFTAQDWIDLAKEQLAKHDINDNL